MTISEGRKVKLHFSLALQGDAHHIINSTFAGSPAELVLGDGNLPESFEYCLLDMHLGEEQTFTLSPDKAFGQYSLKNVHVIPRNKFNHELQKGLLVLFTAKNKQELPGVVTCFDNLSVTVDFNHPLAGQTLLFKVKILDISSSKHEIIATDKTEKKG